LDWISLAVVCVIAFSARSISHIRKRFFGNDAFYHINVARSFEKHIGLPREDPGIVPARLRTYPPLLHYLLVPFSKKGGLGALRSFSPIVDTLVTAILFITAYWIGIEPLWPALFYALASPNVIDASSLNPRPLANLGIVGVGLSAILLVSNGPEPMWMAAFAILVVSETAVMLTNKLALQALVPMTMLVGTIICLFRPISGLLFIAALLVAFLLANLVTKGGYSRIVLKDHIGYIRSHMKLGHYRTGNIELPSTLNLFKSNPMVLTAPIFGILLFLEGHQEPLVLVLFTWALIVVLMSQFWVWGDSWRYLQFGTFPGSIILYEWIATTFGDGYLALSILVLSALALTLILAINLRRALRSDLAETLIGSIEGLPETWKNHLKDRIIHCNIQHYSLAYAGEFKVLMGNPSSEGVEINSRMAAIGTNNFDLIDNFAFGELGIEIDYYIFMKCSGNVTGIETSPVYENDQLGIYTRESIQVFQNRIK
jgi:hypothetical protein